jgi:hypothetical protein
VSYQVYKSSLLAQIATDFFWYEVKCVMSYLSELKQQGKYDTSTTNYEVLHTSAVQQSQECKLSMHLCSLD